MFVKKARIFNIRIDFMNVPKKILKKKYQEKWEKFDS